MNNQKESKAMNNQKVKMTREVMRHTSYESMLVDLLKVRSERALTVEEHESVLRSIDWLLNSGSESAVEWVVDTLAEKL